VGKKKRILLKHSRERAYNCLLDMKAEDEEVKKERDNTLKRSIKDRENGTGEKRSRTGVKMEGGEEQGDSNTLGKDAPERQSKLQKVKKEKPAELSSGGVDNGETIEEQASENHKAKQQGSLHRVSPVFPGWPHPTVEDCELLNRELEALHGVKEQPSQSSKSIMDSLVSTILSQATSAKNYTASFASLKQKFPRWEDLCDAQVSHVEDAIKMGGLAAVKAKRIQAICNSIRAQHGKVCLEHLATAPTESIKEQLSRFPGCGPKTISCVLLFSLKRPDFAVDTHIFRLSSAAGWVPSQAALRHHNQQLLAHQGVKRPTRKKSSSTRRGDGGVEGGGEGRGGGGDGEHTCASWPPVTAETCYLHLNAMIPDPLKYSLHVNLIAHGRTHSPASGPKNPSTCPVARRALALKSTV
jgi:endonuclease-3